MSIKHMDAVELKSLIDQNEELILVDCREQDEWDAGHIAEAEFFPLSKLKESNIPNYDKSKKIVLQCRSGKRSMAAAEILLDHGYEDLTNLDGGIMGWEAEGYPVTK